MIIRGTTKITGILGYPVKHTFSPAMHNAAFLSLGLDFVYIPFEVNPKGLNKAVGSLRALGISGVNITIPHKEKVIDFIDKLDPFARQVGSVNTIVNLRGKLSGYNTDSPGFLRDLVDKGFNSCGKTALLFGSGGAGRAIAAALSLAGAKKIFITDAAEKKAYGLSKKTNRAVFLPFDGWKQKIKESDILINATPVGMRPGNPIIYASELKNGIFVYDLVYNRHTELETECKKAAVEYSDGLGMLLNQGAIAFKCFTGITAPIEVMRKALIKQLSTKQ
jgi:shikimate dehydrogenase